MVRASIDETNLFPGGSSRLVCNWRPQYGVLVIIQVGPETRCRGIAPFYEQGLL